jgi:predicted PurR-regulated permease PerM
MANVAEKLRRLRRPVEQVTKTAEQVAQATGASSGPRAGEVTVRGPSLSARVVDTATSLAFGLIETIILLYFLLAAGDLFLQKLIKVLPQLRDKKKAVQIAREIETSVSTYLSTITLVNFGEAIVVSLAMWAVGMPNPVLWGVLAGVAEFIPYLGAATMTAVLGFAALTTFDNIFHALLIPATYFAINFVQANFVTPVVLGRRLTLNPVAIFIGLLFWWRLWGIPGAFIAVPLIATFKIFCDHIEALAPVGEFLGK